MSVEAIKGLKSGSIWWDKAVPGLHVKAFENKKCYYLYYRTPDRKQKRPRLADCAAVSLPQARKLAQDMLYKVAQMRVPENNSTDITVAGLFQRVWDEHWSTERFKESRWGTVCAGLYNCHIKKELGHMRLADLTPNVVRNWHRNIKGTKKAKPIFAANRALSVLSKMITWAEDNELKVKNGNPCESVEKFPERQRGKYASDVEVKKLCASLQRRYPHQPQAVAYIYTILYTGARPKSLDRILWKDVIEENGCGVVGFSGKSTHKTGDLEWLVFPPALFKMLKEIHAKENFPTLIGIKMPRRMWKEICHECGIEGLWARDLRRTFATIGFQGHDLSKVGEVLNHKSTQTTLIYSKLSHATRIATVSSIARRIDVIVGADGETVIEKEKKVL